MIEARRRRFAQLTVIAVAASAAAFAQSSALPKPPAAARRAYDRARKAESNKQIAEARSGYEAAVNLFPDYAEAWCSLGLLQAEPDRKSVV